MVIEYINNEYIGAVSKGVIEEFLKRFVPVANIPSDVVTALLGWWLEKNPKFSKFGHGLLLASVKDLAETFVKGMFVGIMPTVEKGGYKKEEFERVIA